MPEKLQVITAKMIFNNLLQIDKYRFLEQARLFLNDEKEQRMAEKMILVAFIVIIYEENLLPL